MKLLEGKTAIVTGAASGIGKSTALLFAEEGAKIVVADLNVEGGNEVVKEIESKGGEAIFVKVDTSNPEDAKKCVEQAVAKFGKLDIAVNNAGIVGPMQPVGEFDIEGWNKVIAINLSGVFYGIRYQIPAMLKNGGGSIVNLSSIAGSVAVPGIAAYVSAKHGVIGLTKTAALDHSKNGIRINAVGPGYVDTPMISDFDHEEAKKLHPIGRLAKPEEVAQLILWLASDQSSFVTGAYYPVDGGYLAQ